MYFACCANPIAVITPSSFVLCPSATVTLTANTAVSYTWSTGAHTQSINVTTAGIYTLTNTYTGGCTATQTINIQSPPNAHITVFENSGNAINDGILCGTAFADATASPGSSYLWNNSTTNSQLGPMNVGSSTPYTTVVTVTVTGSYGCPGVVSTASASITWLSLPTLTVVPTPTTACSIELVTSGANTYTWTPGTALSCTVCSSPITTPTTTTNYTVTGTDVNGCVNTTSVSISAIFPISISGSTSICPGGTTTLTAAGAQTYTWSTTANTPSITVSPTVTATYTVAGTNTAGCISSQTVTVTVPTLTITGDPNLNPLLTICSGTTTTLTVVGADTYTWSTGGVTPTITVNPVSTTTYSVTGTTTLTGCVSTQTVSVATIALPTITFTPSSPSVCIGNSINLNANGATSYTWSTGATGSLLTPTPTITTTYSVSGYYQTTGCTGSNSITVVVNPLPTVTISPATPSFCNGNSTTLTAGGANTYSWSTSATTASISVSPTVTTTYSVVGTYTSTGCMASKTVTVTVNPLPTITISPSASPTICAGVTLTLTASGANTYTWDGGSNSPSITVSPTVTTLYPIAATNTLTGCANTLTVIVHVNPLPTVTVSPSTPSTCYGIPIVLTAGGANTYSWSTSATTASISVSPTVTITYTVTGTNTTTCANTKTVTVTVLTNSCSGTQPSYTISSSGTYSPTTGFINQNLYIGNGTNTPSYTITSTDVRIAPSVSITVANHATLVINGSWLHACGTCGGSMWSGIDVLNGGTVIVNNYSIIEDADTAITTQSQLTGTLVPSWNISNTIFNKNGNDLVVYPNFANMSGTSIYNTIFTCRNLTSHSVTSATFTAIKSSIAAATPLVPGSNTSTVTLAGARTSNHIYFNEAANTAGISVGNSAQGNNIFDNADFGINSGLTPLTIKNNSFLNLTGNSTNFTGIGFYASGASFEVGAPTIVIGNATSTVNNAEKNYFTNCLRGIQVFDCQNVAINNNTFNNETTASTFTTSGSHVTGEYAVLQTGFAIHSSSLSTTEQTTFYNNNVQNCATGYYLDFGKLYNTSSPVSMTNNTITAVGTTTNYCNTGIFVQQSNTAGAVSGMPITAFLVSQNVISNVNTNCISVHNVNNVSPTGGFLDIQTNTELSVKPNTYTVIQSPRIAAVRVDGSYYTRVADNPIHCTGTTGTVTPTQYQAGIYVTQSPNSVITCNTIGNIGEGIVFESTSPTYSNNISRNSFDYSKYGFVLRSGGICGDQGTSTFPHDNIWAPGSHFTGQTLSDGSNPNGGTTSKLYCRAATSCTTTTIYMPCLNSSVNSGTVYATGTTLITASGSSSQTCVSDGGSGGSGGRLAASNNTFNADNNSIDTVYYQNIQNTISDTNYTYPAYDIETRWALQHYVNSNSPNSATSHRYENAKTLVLADAALANQDYNTALSLTNSFAPSNIIESNCQTVNNVVVKMQNDTLNANDINNLQQVAVQCHLTGGSIVWRARALLNAYYKTIIEYPNACSVNNDNRIANTAGIKSVINSQMVNVYPNPNTGKMTMEYSITSDAQLRITDVTGKLIGTYTLNAAEKSIELNHESLINGVYLYTVINEQGLVKTGRIVIMK